MWMRKNRPAFPRLAADLAARLARREGRDGYDALAKAVAGVRDASTGVLIVRCSRRFGSGGVAPACAQKPRGRPGRGPTRGWLLYRLRQTLEVVVVLGGGGYCAADGRPLPAHIYV